MLLLVFAHGAAATTNTQIVFSSTSSAGTAPLAPFGFWIWCFASGGTSPYQGKCGGTMYFYGTALSPVVDDGSQSATATSATIHVKATSGVFACTLSGPIGTGVTVVVTCSPTVRPTGATTATATMPASNVAVTPAS